MEFMPLIPAVISVAEMPIWCHWNHQPSQGFGKGYHSPIRAQYLQVAQVWLFDCHAGCLSNFASFVIWRRIPLTYIWLEACLPLLDFYWSSHLQVACPKAWSGFGPCWNKWNWKVDCTQSFGWQAET
jgi:hypothetical protein